MKALRNLPFLTTVAIFLLAYAICIVQFPNMLSTRVIGNLLTDNAFLGIAAVGMTFVILSGGIDLSVGSVIAFTSVFVAVLVGQLGVHPLVAFALILVIAALFGAWMGMMIHFLRIPPFVATLAGMFLARRGLPHLDAIRAHRASVSRHLAGTLFPPAGRRQADIHRHGHACGLHCRRHHRPSHAVRRQYLRAGRQPTVGRADGRSDCPHDNRHLYDVGYPFRPRRDRLYALYVVRLFAGDGGVELDAIASVVIGGTLLTGGAGLVAGTFVGILIQGLIQTYIVFDGTLSSWWTKIAIGILLFLFIALQRGLAWFSDLRRIPKSGNRFSGKMRVETNS